MVAGVLALGIAGGAVAEANASVVRPPVAGAASAAPNVGVTPSNLRYTAEGEVVGVDRRFEAVRFCQATKRVPFYSGFVKRRASQFGVTVSETGDSGSAGGVVITTDAAAAMKLMAEMRSTAQACVKPRSKRIQTQTLYRVKRVHGLGQDAFEVLRETVSRSGSLENSRGQIQVISREGRTIVARSTWVYFAKPITRTGDLPESDVISRVRDSIVNALH